MSPDELQEIEATVVELAQRAGELLLGYFDRPLQVDYKSANSRNPVTEADHAVDEFLRTEITQRYPEHSVITEEFAGEPTGDSPIVWVIDPLDGTSNFLNGLPIFGVLIAVLEAGKPVASAIFIPSIKSPQGRVIHARAGGGAFEGEERLSVVQETEPPRRMATFPSYFLRMFNFGPRLRRRLGDVRSIGSAGYELAMAATGVFDYVVFNGPWVWDLAAGALLVQEAGGRVVVYNRRSQHWDTFERFGMGPKGESPTYASLRRWQGTMMLGNQQAVDFISSGLGLKLYRLNRVRRRVLQRVAQLVGRSHARGQSQGQGRSRRE
jgi:myo-inositol-1(or 4)-monophosphatase